MTLQTDRRHSRKAWQQERNAAPAPCFPDSGDIALRITFYPPSRRIDRQNMPHLAKAYCDGLAEAWGVNDKRFAPEYVYAEPVRGGAVHVEVMP